MHASPVPVGSNRMAFRMTIGLPRPWPDYPHHTGLISASCTSNPRLRHRLSSDPALRRTPLPRRMVPVITVHRGLPPPECTSLLDTPGETACPTHFANPCTARKVGQTVSSAGPPESIFHTSSARGRGSVESVPALTLGAI